MIWRISVAVIVWLVVSFAYTSWYFRWEERGTRGMAYYGLPVQARRALKRRISWLSLPAKPLLSLLAVLFRRQMKMPFFTFEGVAGPEKVSGADVFAKAKAYRPQREDVFVATQMRCGTTWMQQIVYEVVSGGAGDLSDGGHNHLYAISPWIDAVNSVSMENAPMVGRRQTRIIKTHLPASLCPYSPDAKYIYVARHPVSCFASIVDFNRSMLGPMMPSIETLVAWYCSDEMYWLPWPRHVDGWWRFAQDRDNVLVVQFEALKKNPGAEIDRVAAFLGCTLTVDERARVLEKTSFQYMKNHEEWFEMAPPTMYSVAGGEFLASGKAARDADVSPAVREKILRYCRQTLEGSSSPVAIWYPDIAGSSTGAEPVREFNS